MNEYVKGLVNECPEDLRKGTAMTTAVIHLFQVNAMAEKLSASDAEVLILTFKLLSSS